MTQIITVNGGNLYQVAAQYLGDASQWIRIAILNGMSDPFFATTIPLVLVIPDIDATQTGGTPPQ